MHFPGVNIETGEFKTFSVNDILFVSVKKDQSYIHTFTGIYRRINGIKEFVQAFEPAGFELVDRSTLAQLSKVTRYDPILRIAYYDHPDFPTQACFVSEEKGKSLKI
jgi:DNA-binding LytR/AlgR family response regulator